MASTTDQQQEREGLMEEVEPGARSPFQDDVYDGPEPDRTHSTDFHIRTRSADSEEEASQLPVWLRESSKGFHWRWVPLPVRTFCRAVDDWSRGPKPPQIHTIRPIWPAMQEAPLWVVDKYLPKKRYKAAGLGVVYMAWLLAFSLVLRHSAQGGNIEGYGIPESIWCGASLWNGGNGCGLDGNNCRPFANSSLAFRCPATCASLITSQPRAVGTQSVLFEPFVVGGGGSNSSVPAVYRGDSFICQAALHAGITSNSAGGCGVLHLAGAHSSFPASLRNGIQSTSFDASFPKSFSFDASVPASCGAPDPRWPLLGITASATLVLSLTISSASVFFGSTFTLLFFHVGLVSDKPNISAYNALFSLIIGRFLPGALAAYVIYLTSVRRTLAGLRAQGEKSVLWVGAAWVGALSNYTLDFIPIQRLTPKDLAAQAGAALALTLIVLLICVIAAGQIYHLRLEGRLRSMLAVYGLMGAGLLAGVALPSLNLRIHHYLLALIFLPGTGMQTRASLAYQGLLVGLFVNGVARWGFDSVLQTSGELAGSGPADTLLPEVTAVVGAGGNNITFGWGRGGPVPRGWDGVSVLRNDVERYRWYEGEGRGGWTWKGERAGDGRRGREYFRFAWLDGSEVGDYTKAGVWEEDGGWRQMEGGPS